MTNLEELNDFLQSSRKIVLTSHVNPDGDAVGSSLGLYHFLKKRGHEVQVLLPNAIPDFLHWLPSLDQIRFFDSEEALCRKYIQEADLIFSLDYNGLYRIEEMGALIAKTEVRKVMIDHHLEPEDFADYQLSDPSASSTCELVYDFIQMLDGLDELDQKMLNCLYTGILTDTGAFRHATSPKLFRIAADLNERGVDNTGLQDLLFNSYSEKRLRLLGFCIHERMEVYPAYRTAVIALSQRDYQQYDIQRGDLEGVVNFLLRIQHVRFAALITERRNIVKLSMRSKGTFSVQQIAVQHFNGGGHRNAAGGSSEESLSKTLQRFKEILPDYETELWKNESVLASEE